MRIGLLGMGTIGSGAIVRNILDQVQRTALLDGLYQVCVNLTDPDSLQ